MSNFLAWGAMGIESPVRRQPSPDGLAQAFIIGENFIGNASALVLGDNIFYGHDFHRCWAARWREEGATVFAYHVQDPERYGVVEFDANGKVLSLEEKPASPRATTP